MSVDQTFSVKYTDFSEILEHPTIPLLLETLEHPALPLLLETLEYLALPHLLETLEHPASPSAPAPP